MLGRFVPEIGPSGQTQLTLSGTNRYVSEADMIPVQEQLVRLMTENHRVWTDEDL